MQAPRQIRILSVGNDVSLLSSRANLLTHAGYLADLEVDEDRSLRRLRARHYHLVIVSNNLSRDEQLGIRAKCKQVKPDVPVLLLTEKENEAAQFLATVAACLGRNKDNAAIRASAVHTRHVKRL